MKKIEKTILYFILASMLYSCGGFSDAGKAKQPVSLGRKFIILDIYVDLIKFKP